MKQLLVLIIIVFVNINAYTQGNKTWVGGTGGGDVATNWDPSTIPTKFSKIRIENKFCWSDITY